MKYVSYSAKCTRNTVHLGLSFPHFFITILAGFIFEKLFLIMAALAGVCKRQRNPHNQPPPPAPLVQLLDVAKSIVPCLWLRLSLVHYRARSQAWGAPTNVHSNYKQEQVPLPLLTMLGYV